MNQQPSIADIEAMQNEERLRRRQALATRVRRAKAEHGLRSKQLSKLTGGEISQQQVANLLNNYTLGAEACDLLEAVLDAAGVAK